MVIKEGLAALRMVLPTLVIGFSSLAAWADEPEIVFPIRAFQLEGARLLPPAPLEEALAAHVGERSSYATIQQAAAAVERLYAAAGYGAVRVAVPAQDITSGTVRLRMAEALVGQVEISGNQHFDDENILATVPGLRQGEVPNTADIAASVRLSNESFAKRTQVTFRQGQAPETVDAVVRVADTLPLRMALTLDNSGTPTTGAYRLGYAIQHANVLNRDHVLTAQFVTSPDHVGDVAIVGANYRIPLYQLGGMLDFTGAYSNVNAGLVATTAGSYSISGSGSILGLRYTHLLPRHDGWDPRLALGLEQRRYRNGVTLAGSSDSLLPDLAARPATLTYSGEYADERQAWGGSLALSRNLPGGDRNTTEDYRAPGGRSEARADYTIWRAALHYDRALAANWQLRTAFLGQYSRDALIPGEQFGVGGADSVRGFREREVINDRGYRASLELLSPGSGGRIELPGVTARGVLFYDTGEVWRNRPLAGEIAHARIASAGVGLRVQYRERAHLRLDYASVVQGGNVRQAGDQMLQASLTVMF